MPFTYRHVALPPVWPGTATPEGRRKRGPFRANWGDTLDRLAFEVGKLNGRDVTLAVGVQSGARDIRADGGVRADARIRNPAVILDFTAGKERLSFPCDTYDYWQDNVRAIALALEALRAVDRYGVQQGRQYQGFKALPGAGQSTTTMDVITAATTVADISAIPAGDVRRTADAARRAVRIARAKAHPDMNNGTREQWDDVNQAAAALAAHHGIDL